MSGASKTGAGSIGFAVSLACHSQPPVSGCRVRTSEPGKDAGLYPEEGGCPRLPRSRRARPGGGAGRGAAPCPPPCCLLFRGQHHHLPAARGGCPPCSLCPPCPPNPCRSPDTTQLAGGRRRRCLPSEAVSGLVLGELNLPAATQRFGARRRENWQKVQRRKEQYVF